MNAPFIVLFLTFICALFVHIKYQSPFWLAKRKLDKALQQKGLKSVIYDRILILRMIKNPKVIFSDSDSSEIQGLKQSVVDHFIKAQRSLPIIVKIMFCGFTLSIFVAWLTFYINGK